MTTPSTASRASRAFYDTDARTLAKRLLGASLIHMTHDGEAVGGRIVETEAYLGVRDAAAHSHGGRRTPRNESMYARPGTAYVYFTYGMHHCMNIVCGRIDEPVAVLIRALEPQWGVETMTRRRSQRRRPESRPLAPQDLCSGPARLCQALDLDRESDGRDLVTDPALYVIPRNERRAPAMVNRPRVGIDSAGAWRDRLLRWYVKDSEHVSRR